jgi:ABC-2 type transport system permease protein
VRQDRPDERTLPSEFKMRALYIALKDLKMRLRDRNTLVMMLLLPVGMTAIIGFAFGGESGISAVEFLLVAPEEGGFLADAASGFLSQHELFDVERATEEEARRAVAAGEKSAAVVIPEGLLDSVLTGAPAEVRVLLDPASNIKAGIVQAMIEQFVSVVSAGRAVGRGVFETLDQAEPLGDSEHLALWGWMFMWMRDAWTEPPVSLDTTTADTDDINVHAYFAPGFAVFFLLFTMLASAKTIHEERESGTYERLMAAPLSKTSIIAGKMTGSYVLAAIQILTLIALGGLLFGIKWGSHPGATIIMALVTAAGATSLAMVIAAAARTGRQTDNVGTAIILVMSLMGGSMWPIEQAPEAFQRFGRFTFNYWAHSGFKRLVFDDAGLAGITQEISIICAMSAVFVAVAVLLLSRRRI